MKTPFWRGLIDGLALGPLMRWLAGRPDPWRIPGSDNEPGQRNRSKP